MKKQFENVSCEYGAPMGRKSSPLNKPETKSVRLFRVTVNSQGYDDGGAYWGTGEPLFCARNDDGYIDFVRAKNRFDAAAMLDLKNETLLKPLTINEIDGRYTIQKEFCGYQAERWVCRFMLDFIAHYENKSHAIDAAISHRKDFLQNTPKTKLSVPAQIKIGMAKAFFACAYADQAEECDRPLRGEIMDQLPTDIDPAALHAANTLINDLLVNHWPHRKDELMRVHEIHKEGALLLLYAHIQKLDSAGSDRELTPELFGHYCAMQAMGTGVGLESFGNVVRSFVQVPYVEFGSHSLEKDYF